MTSAAQQPAGDERALAALEPGEHGVIASVECPPHITRRLMELGLTPGTAIELVRRAPLGDPLEITVRGIHLWLRRSEAMRINVTTA